MKMVMELDHIEFVRELVFLLSEKQAKRFKALVLGEANGRLQIGMADVNNIVAVDELARILKRPLDFIPVDEEALLDKIEQLYQKNRDLAGYASRVAEEISRNPGSVTEERLNRGEEPAVIQMLQAIFESAVQVGASDIHIEPAEDKLRIRLRVDGLLQEQVIPLVAKNGVVAAITQRLKLMGQLNIAERRLPQDGRFDLKISGMDFSIRMSTMPVQWGESIVMRLLSKANKALNLDDSGMSEDILKNFRSLVRTPNGIILVTGPTGSGKTTTLYSVLTEISDVSKNIITIEDPIEYQLERANQVQVNTQIGLTFAETLRSVLRQDPDIILIGEIRDHETAEIALRSALTGHTVFSTLHTNDAGGVAERLIDMGLEPYLVAAALRGVVAQRLVRCVCPRCAVVQTPSDFERIVLTELFGKTFELNTYIKGTGCKFCRNTGCRGMMGVYELLVLDSELRDSLKQGSSVFKEVLKQRENQQNVLAKNAFELAIQKIISLDEVMKVICI